MIEQRPQLHYSTAGQFCNLHKKTHYCTEGAEPVLFRDHEL
jgi:hypothetical protein